MNLTPQARKLLLEASRRAKLQHKQIDFLDGAFPAQVNFLKDPAKKKAAHCPRRAAKSYTAGLGLFRMAFNHPKVKCLYCAPTREMARGIMWKEVIEVIDAKFQIGCDMNETRLEATLPNGSVIRLLGIDADAKQAKKVLGQKYKLVVLDEVAFFDYDVRSLVDKLDPAMAELDGEIWLTSTSSDLAQGLFFDVTREEKELREKGWSVHEWSWEENPYYVEAGRRKIAELRAQNPLIDLTPTFQQHWLNKWTTSESALVYRFNHSNVIDKAPELTNWMLGVDLGFNDATAFVVGGWNDKDKTLYILESYKESGLDFTAVAQKIEWYRGRFKFYTIVIDGANKQGVEEMIRRHELPLERAEKASKFDYIRLMNGDFITQRIKLVNAFTKDLQVEYSKLIKDPLAKIPKEHPKCENHCADAALYMWRQAYNFLSEVPKPKVRLTREQQAEQEAKLMEEALIKEAQDRKNQNDLYDMIPDTYEGF